MATAPSTGSSYLVFTDNQRRWLVEGIALNTILIPQIRPFVEQGINTEYNTLKTSHNIHVQSSRTRLKRWPATKFLRYENINGNDARPKLHGGKFHYSLFDCHVNSHVDFARLYVEKHMAKFTAFDDHCDASAVLSLLGGVPVFSAAASAAGDVRKARNDWAHCVFSKWDPAKFRKCFTEMEQLVKNLALPSVNERELLGELKDWETKGTRLCMNSPVDPALLQLVQVKVKSLQDVVDNMCRKFNQQKTKIQQELQNIAVTLNYMEKRLQRLEIGQQNLKSHVDDLKGCMQEKMEKLESGQQTTERRTVRNEDNIRHLREQVDDLAKSKEADVKRSYQGSPTIAIFPQKFVELIKRKYKGAVLCPFPWCEDELQLQLSKVFTRLKIVGKKKERARLTEETVSMTDAFRSHEECEVPRVVLIEGQPGIGKTTCCLKLAYDWSMECISAEACFPKVEILLMLNCHDMKTADIKEAIYDQLLPLDAEEKEKENFFCFIHHNQSRIVLVLDGLDELSETLYRRLLPLIKGRVFPSIYLILTARHELGMKVRRYCDTLLEIVGYTLEDANTYIEKYFSNHDHPSLAKKLIKNLRKNPQLRELTANPLNTALLCLICEDSLGKLPFNKTMLYNELVSCVLMRYAQKKGISLDRKDPIEVFTEQLNQLGELALEALLRDQLYFTTDKLQGQSTEFLDFGLLSREASASKIRPKLSYAFTHKTFQEYFAAFHLAQELLTDGKDKAALLSRLSPPDKYWSVWEFLITMASRKSGDVAVLLVSSLCASLQHKMPERFCYHNYLAEEEDSDVDDDSHDGNVDDDEDIDRDDPLDTDVDFDTDVNFDTDVDFDPSLIIETDHDIDLYNYHQYRIDPCVCEDRSFDWPKRLGSSILSGGIREVVLTKTIFLIAQCEEPKSELKDYQKKMAYELARCFPLDKLKVSHLYTQKDSLLGCSYIQVFSEYLKVHCQLTRLVWLAELDKAALVTIEHILRSSVKLTYLHLNNDLRSTSLTPVLRANRTLTHLNLRNAKIRNAGAEALEEVLRENCTLTHASLRDNEISHIGAEALARGLEFNKVLVHLDIRNNWIGNQGAVAFAKAFELNSTLKYFDVGIDYITPRELEYILDSGINAIAKSLRSNCSLTYLDVRGSIFSDSSAAALGEALRSNRTLSHLYLNSPLICSQLEKMGIQFGNLAAAAFKRALQSRDTKITHLNLSNTSITSSCAKILAEALHSNTTLIRLDLSENKIDSRGAEAIANGLKSNRTLTHLKLRVNQISDAGAVRFAQCLQSNRTLLYLDLIENGIKRSGAAAIAEALKSNWTLTHLQLGWNEMGDTGAMKFADTLLSNKTLIFVSLIYNEFSESGRNMLVEIEPLISCKLRI
ncbi:protein NLRC5-like [Stylophora pistillata]|uniref:protein NLRC5-like n=1 Tax=Stylophora pistillata TaxID=50429 RepID=UPI000C03EAD8|nr:protein NLRC5-like [Stylophora pistillata]XP_022783850.1 protein NLRC5-like [Stylophora pistillata]